MSTRKRRVVEHRRRTQRNLLYVAVATVLGIAAVLAVVLSRPGTSTTAATPQVRPVSTTGNPLPRFDTATSDAAVGMTIPTVTGTSFDGSPVSISNDGKAKVVLFVAHWCPHCRREVPLLASALRQTPLPPNVEMITISTGVNANAPNYPPSEWLAGVKWPTPVLADDGESSAASAYGLTGFPYFVFVDAHNQVVARSSGEMPLADFNQHVAAVGK